MSKTRVAYRGYRIDICGVGSSFSYAIDRMRPELPIAGRRTEHRLDSEEQAVKVAKQRVDVLLNTRFN